MKLKILFFFIVFVSLFPFFVASAAPEKTSDYGLGAAAAAAGLKANIGGASTLPDLAAKIVKAGLSLIGVIFFVLMLYAGLVWMKAMGSSDEVTKAKDIMQAAIIGLVIVSGAYALTNFVFTSLGVSKGAGGTSGTKTANSGSKDADSSAAVATKTAKEKCTIQNEKWSDGKVILTGGDGNWKCVENGIKPGVACPSAGGECQPLCTYNNPGGKCQQPSTCASGKNKTKSSACPNNGTCCF